MNESDIANVVVRESINRMIERERKEFDLSSVHAIAEACPFIDKATIDQVCETTVETIVSLKISLVSGLN